MGKGAHRADIFAIAQLSCFLCRKTKDVVLWALVSYAPQ